MDRTGADFDRAVEEMRKKLGAYAYAVMIPIGKEDYFKGVIDVVNQKAIIYDDTDEVGLKYTVTEIAEEDKERAKQAREELVDAVSNKDDEIAGLVIEGKEISTSV